jgi:hypothetical protein
LNRLVGDTADVKGAVSKKVYAAFWGWFASSQADLRIIRTQADKLIVLVLAISFARLKVSSSRFMERGLNELFMMDASIHESTKTSRTFKFDCWSSNKMK